MTKRPKIVGGKKGTSIFVAAPVTKNEDMSIKVFYLTEKKGFRLLCCVRVYNNNVGDYRKRLFQGEKGGKNKIKERPADANLLWV